MDFGNTLSAVIAFVQSVIAMWPVFLTVFVLSLAYIPVFVSWLKSRGYVPDGQSANASLIMQVAFFLVFIGFRLFAPSVDLAAIDTFIVAVLKVVVMGVSLWLQLGASRLSYTKATSKLPGAAGFSYNS